MNEEQIKIWNYLNQYAKGYANRKSSKEITSTCNLRSGGPTNEHPRNLIRNMIFDHGCCIGSIMYKSCYWIIENKGELNTVLESLKKRANGVLGRANALKDNWKNQNEKK